MNALIGERGLEHRNKLPPLVVDRTPQPLQCSSEQEDKKQQRHSVHASLHSPDESDSDSDMDRRWKRGRGGRRRRSRQSHKPPPTVITSAKQQQQITSRREEEGIKVRTA